LHSKAVRQLALALESGQSLELPAIEGRTPPKENWWETLSIDPETLSDPKARLPKGEPYRPHTQRYIEVLNAISLTEKQKRLLQTHYHSKNRTISIPQLAKSLGYANHSSINLQYGKLTRSIAESSNYKPTKRED
jgi:hypothetical protein